MPAVPARPWFLAGFAHLGAAALLGAIAAAPSARVEPSLHVLVALAGVFLLAGGLMHGFLAPFLKREPRTAMLAHASFALVLAADLAGLAAPWLDALQAAHAEQIYGAAFLLFPLHVLLAAFWGAPWRGGIALFAKDQPFRRGDLFVLAGVGAALAGLVAASVVLLAQTRGHASAAPAILLLAFAIPFFHAFLAFILPRNAKAPLPGITLHAVALALTLAAAAGLAYAFARPFDADFRVPAATALVAAGLALVAFARLRFPTPLGPQVRRARPFLRGAFALALLAPIVLVLATVRFPPQLDLLAVALYAHLVLVALLAVACALFGAPILLNAIPREGRWGAWTAALAIAALFLLAPSIQYERSLFPAAATLLAAAAILLWGVAPLRTPRRDCPP